MRTFTMQGIAPNPNWQRRVKAHRRIEAEPVFQLTRELQRASWRPIVVRIAGLLVLAAALLGSARIFGHSTARRQALSWVTLGHADVVLGAVR